MTNLKFGYNICYPNSYFKMFYTENGTFEFF